MMKIDEKFTFTQSKLSSCLWCSALPGNLLIAWTNKKQHRKLTFVCLNSKERKNEIDYDLIATTTAGAVPTALSPINTTKKSSTKAK